MDQISLGLAFIAGVISFLSPCVLPLIPGYISFLSGLSLEELKSGKSREEIIKKAGMTSVFFVIGFSIVFIFLGASATFLGKFLGEHIMIFTKIAGIIIILLGLHLAGLLKIKWLNMEKRVKISNASGGPLGAFLIGLAFAFGWTPCIGPILGGILTLAATKETVIDGVVLLSFYSLGLGIPFIITGFSVVLFTRFFERYRRFIRWTEIAAAILLIIIGILIFSGNLTVLLKLVPPSLYKFAK